MSAKDMVRQWRKVVSENLLPGLHGHQQAALALFSWAMSVCGSCCAGLVAAAAPSERDADPASERRRMERLLANQRLDATAAMLSLTGATVRNWGGCGRRLVLILDETPKGEPLRCMRLSMAFHRRTLPLLSVCYATDAPPMPMPKLVRWMLRKVAEQLPPAVTVTLLADRGLCWPTLIRQCRRLGWHYLLRLQGGTRVRLLDGSERAAEDLVSRRGERCFVEDVRVFKKARWLRANVVAAWDRRCREGPWLLVSDQAASYRRCRAYCTRTWCEESHRDDKSHGLNWQRSQVNDPRHAQRLMLLIALASLLCIATGIEAIRQGARRLFEARRQTQLSVFQIGRRWLFFSLCHELDLLRPIPARPP